MSIGWLLGGLTPEMYPRVVSPSWLELDFITFAGICCKFGFTVVLINAFWIVTGFLLSSIITIEEEGWLKKLDRELLVARPPSLGCTMG
jgi:hypothetical protein